MKRYLSLLSALAALACVTAATAQTIIDDFEYASDDDLVAAWTPSGGATLTLSDSVAPKSAGKKSLRVEFSFPQMEWATETVKGLDRPASMAILPTQYLTFRLRGDTNFSKADFRNLYLYAYDEDGNFGRWGSAVPATDDWQVMNYLASTIEKPWDSTQLPDLNRIIRFAFFQYGSQAAIDPYIATIYVDDLMVRDTPLVEFPPASAPRELIDDFESYANDTALRGFYKYENSPAATVTTASLASAAPQESKALSLAISFAPGQWPWGSVRSGIVPAFSFPTNGVATVQLKGDPALASIADAGTTFWLSFYDKAGRGMNFTTPADPVISAEWTTLQARFEDFNNNTTVDTGNLVQWRILVEGWQGVAETTEMSGSFQVDNIRIAPASAQQPTLSIARNGASITIAMAELIPGTTYDLQTTSDLTKWSTATTITATSATATFNVTPLAANAYYRLVQTTSP
jgi:hypothetical protein